MVFSLDIYIVCNNEPVRQNVLNSLPDETDDRVHSDTYKAPIERQDEDGDWVISGRIRFNQVGDLQNFRAILKGLNGVFAQCDPLKTFIKGHNCYHDEIPPKPCKDALIFEDRP